MIGPKRSSICQMQFRWNLHILEVIWKWDELGLATDDIWCVTFQVLSIDGEAMQSVFLHCWGCKLSMAGGAEMLLPSWANIVHASVQTPPDLLLPIHPLLHTSPSYIPFTLVLLIQWQAICASHSLLESLSHTQLMYSATIAIHC